MSPSLDVLCPNNGWCTYEAIDQTSIIFEIALLVAFAVAALVIVRYFMIIVRCRRENSHWRRIFGQLFIEVYIIMLAWVLCSLIKVSINIFAYFQYIRQDFRSFPNPNIQSGIFALSMLFNSFDNGATFFLVYVIIFIPCHWLEIILNRAKESLTSEITFTSRKLYSFVFQAVKVINIYLKLRFIMLLICFLEPIFAITIENGCKLSGYIVLYRIAQSSVILLFYILGYAVMLTMNETHLIKISKKDFKQLKLQYFLLMISLLTRIFMNLAFKGFAEEIFAYTPEINCFDQNRNNDVKRSVALLIAEVIMHFMPIGVVIYIYRPNLDRRQKEPSIYKSGEEEINVDDVSIEDQSYKIQKKSSLHKGLQVSKI